MSWQYYRNTIILDYKSTVGANNDIFNVDTILAPNKTVSLFLDFPVSYLFVVSLNSIMSCTPFTGASYSYLQMYVTQKPYKILVIRTEYW